MRSLKPHDSKKEERFFFDYVIENILLPSFISWDYFSSIMFIN